MPGTLNTLSAAQREAVTRALRRERRLSTHERLLLQEIFSLAAIREDMTAFASQSYLSRELGVHRGNLQRVLARFEQLGLVAGRPVHAGERLPNGTASMTGGYLLEVRFRDPRTLDEVLSRGCRPQRQLGRSQRQGGVPPTAAGGAAVSGTPILMGKLTEGNDLTSPPPPREPASTARAGAPRVSAREAEKDRAPLRVAGLASEDRAPLRGAGLASAPSTTPTSSRAAGAVQNARTGKSGRRKKGTREVAEHWRDRLAPGLEHLDDGVLDVVDARLRGGWSAGELKLAVDGAMLSHINRDDPSRQTVEAVFGSSDRVRALVQRARQELAKRRSRPGTTSGSSPGRSTAQNVSQEQALSSELQFTLADGVVKMLDHEPVGRSTKGGRHGDR